MLQEYDALYEEYYNCNMDRAQTVADKISALGMKILDESKDLFSLNDAQRDMEVVVSLTSIPERLEAVVYPIQCMLVQTYKPDKVVLWLDKLRLSDDVLPDKLVELKRYGLDIYYVEDIGPHTKYYYAMRKFCDALIITIDDDVFYKRTLIEELMDTHKLNPACVCAHWVWKMKFTSNGIPYPFRDFYLGIGEEEFEASHDLLALGVGGVLYPQGCLRQEAFDLDAIRELAWRADDIWLKAMEILNDVKVAKVRGKYFRDPFVENTQERALNLENHAGGNDRTIKNVFQRFNLMRYFRKSEELAYSKYRIIKRWLILYQKNIRLADYFQKKHIRTAAVYGMGDIGELVLQDLRDSSVKVLYGIDRRADQLQGGVPILRLEEIKEQVDMVIIAAKVDYDDIKKSILQYMECDVMTLEDVLAEAGW